MGNAKSGLGLGHFVVDLKKTADVKESLYSLINMDNDLTDNEDYFQDDTLELGYESEAERIIKEALEEFGQPTTPEEFEVVAKKVFNAIDEQEYFGVCDLSVVKISKHKVSLAYSYGGDYGV